MGDNISPTLTTQTETKADATENIKGLRLIQHLLV
jgi:hypothetical protein